MKLVVVQESKKFTPDEVYEEIYYLLSKCIRSVNSVNSAASFVEVILTRSEKLMIGKRVAIAFLLRKGAKYDEVCYILRVSRGTVARVNDRLENSLGFQKHIDRILRQEEIDLALLNFFEKLAKLGSIGKGGSAWRQVSRNISTEKQKKLISRV
jgi:uncharacterized protein YerC